jgi:hypothetical protein
MDEVPGTTEIVDVDLVCCPWDSHNLFIPDCWKLWDIEFDTRGNVKVNQIEANIGTENICCRRCRKRSQPGGSCH